MMKKLSMSKNALRGISIFLLAAFFSQEILFGQGVSPLWNEVAEAKAANPLGRENASSRIAIPEQSGITQKSVSKYGQDVIINIQDAHSKLGAQESIVQILDSLVKNYDLKLIALEGASTAIDTSIISSFPVEETRRKAATSLMQEGKISAGEFYSMVSGEPVTLYGVDDPALYRENLDVFRALVEKKVTVRKELKGLQRALHELETKINSPELIDFARHKLLHQEGSFKFTEYWDYFSQKAKEKGVDHTRYPNLQKLSQIVTLEKKIDFKKASLERGALIGELNGRLSKSDLEKLILESLRFKQNKTSSGRFHELVATLSQKMGISPEPYTNIILYAEYAVIYESIDLLSVLEETAAFENDIREKIFRNDDERQLSNLVHSISILSQLADTTLSSKDYEFFVQNEASCEIASIRRALRTLGEKYQVPAQSYVDFEILESAIPNAKQFYKLASKRNHALMENTLKRMKKSGVHVAALVTGGFHSEGISELMDSEKLSYLVVMPKFDEKSADRPYITILTRKPKEYEEQFKDSDFYLAYSIASVTEGSPNAEAAVKERVEKIFLWANTQSGKLSPSNRREWVAEYTKQTQLFYETTGERSYLSPKQLDELYLQKGRVAPDGKVTFTAEAPVFDTLPTPTKPNRPSRQASAPVLARAIVSDKGSSASTSVPASAPVLASAPAKDFAPTLAPPPVLSAARLAFWRPGYLDKLHEGVGDKDLVSGRPDLKPTWRRLRLLASVFLDSDKVSFDSSEIKSAAIKKFANGFVPAPEDHVEPLLKRLIDLGLIVKVSKGYMLNVSREIMAVKMDDSDFISRQLRAAIGEDGAPVNTEELNSLIETYSKVVTLWPAYPVESHYPILRAISMMKHSQQNKLKDFLTSDANKHRTRMVARILITLFEIIPENYIHDFAPNLEGLTVYNVSPEISNVSGGLGPVMQYLTAAMKRLSEAVKKVMGRATTKSSEVKVVTMQPRYTHKLRPTGRLGSDGKEIIDVVPIGDYGKLPSPITGLTASPTYTFQVPLSSGRSVTAEAWKGKDENGLDAYLVSDQWLPGSDEAITKIQYHYGEYGSADRQDFIEFFGKAAKHLIVLLELEKMKEEKDEYKGFATILNDGQSGGLAAYLVPDEDKKETDEYKVLSRNYRVAVSHTYGNRQELPSGSQGGWRLIAAGIAERLHHYASRGLGAALDWTSMMLRTSFLSLKVSGPHQEINFFDPMAETQAATNGSHREKSRAAFTRAVHQIDPDADMEHLTKLQVEDGKKQAIRNAKSDPELLRLNKNVQHLDPDKITYGVFARCVSVKIDAYINFIRENIRAVQERNGQMVIFANVQPGDQSPALFAKLKQLEGEFPPGTFVVFNGWGPEEKLKGLAMTHVQVMVSARGTGAAEFTEADIYANYGIQFAAPWIEGITQLSGKMMTVDDNGEYSGNVIIPNGPEWEDLKKVYETLGDIFTNTPDQFFKLLAESGPLGRALSHLGTGAMYWEAISDMIGRFNDPIPVLEAVVRGNADAREHLKNEWFRRRLHEYLENHPDIAKPIYDTGNPDFRAYAVTIDGIKRIVNIDVGNRDGHDVKKDGRLKNSDLFREILGDNIGSKENVVILDAVTGTNLGGRPASELIERGLPVILRDPGVEILQVNPFISASTDFDNTRAGLAVTLTPEFSSSEMLEKMLEAGMRVVNFDLSQGTEFDHEWALGVAARVRALAANRKILVSIVLIPSGDDWTNQLRFGIDKLKIDAAVVDGLSSVDKQEIVQRLLQGSAAPKLPLIAKISSTSESQNLDSIFPLVQGIWIDEEGLGKGQAGYPAIFSGLMNAATKSGKIAWVLHDTDNPDDTKKAIEQGAGMVIYSGDNPRVGTEPHKPDAFIAVMKFTHQIIADVEQTIDERDRIRRLIARKVAELGGAGIGGKKGWLHAIQIAEGYLSQSLDYTAVVVFTLSGGSAMRLIELGVPVIAITPVESTARRLNLIRGVRPVQVSHEPEDPASFDIYVSAISAYYLRLQIQKEKQAGKNHYNVLMLFGHPKQAGAHFLDPRNLADLNGNHVEAGARLAAATTTPIAAAPSTGPPLAPSGVLVENPAARLASVSAPTTAAANRSLPPSVVLPKKPGASDSQRPKPSSTPFDAALKNRVAPALGPSASKKAPSVSRASTGNPRQLDLARVMPEVIVALKTNSGTHNEPLLVKAQRDLRAYMTNKDGGAVAEKFRVHAAGDTVLYAQKAEAGFMHVIVGEDELSAANISQTVDQIFGAVGRHLQAKGEVLSLLNRILLRQEEADDDLQAELRSESIASLRQIEASLEKSFSAASPFVFQISGGKLRGLSSTSQAVSLEDVSRQLAEAFASPETTSLSRAADSLVEHLASGIANGTALYDAIQKTVNRQYDAGFAALTLKPGNYEITIHQSLLEGIKDQNADETIRAINKQIAVFLKRIAGSGVEDVNVRFNFAATDESTRKLAESTGNFKRSQVVGQNTMEAIQAAFGDAIEAHIVVARDQIVTAQKLGKNQFLLNILPVDAQGVGGVVMSAAALVLSDGNALLPGVSKTRDNTFAFKPFTELISELIAAIQTQQLAAGSAA